MSRDVVVHSHVLHLRLMLGVAVTNRAAHVVNILLIACHLHLSGEVLNPMTATAGHEGLTVC